MKIDELHEKDTPKRLRICRRGVLYPRYFSIGECRLRWQFLPLFVQGSLSWQIQANKPGWFVIFTIFGRHDKSRPLSSFTITQAVLFFH